MHVSCTTRSGDTHTSRQHSTNNRIGSHLSQREQATACTEQGGHPSRAAPRTLHDGVPSRGGLGGGGAGRGGGPRKAQHPVLQTLHEGGGAGQGGAPGSSASSAGSNGCSAARAKRQSKAQPARNVIKAENLPYACGANMSTLGDAKRTRGRRGGEARRRGRQGRRGERGEENVERRAREEHGLGPYPAPADGRRSTPRARPRGVFGTVASALWGRPWRADPKPPSAPPASTL